MKEPGFSANEIPECPIHDSIIATSARSFRDLFPRTRTRAVALELSPFFFLLAGRVPWRAWLLVATCFHSGNVLLLNISFYPHVLIYLPFVAFARSFGRLNVGARATNAVFSWRIPVIICAIILGVAHTAQRLEGGGSQFLFVEGVSAVRLSLYVSLVLLALCAAVIATDLTTRVYDTKLHHASAQSGIP
jgi:hypothetical protein